MNDLPEPVLIYTKILYLYSNMYPNYSTWNDLIFMHWYKVVFYYYMKLPLIQMKFRNRFHSRGFTSTLKVWGSNFEHLDWTRSTEHIELEFTQSWFPDRQICDKSLILFVLHFFEFYSRALFQFNIGFYKINCLCNMCH